MFFLMSTASHSSKTCDYLIVLFLKSSSLSHLQFISTCLSRGFLGFFLIYCVFSDERSQNSRKSKACSGSPCTEMRWSEIPGEIFSFFFFFRTYLSSSTGIELLRTR